MYSRGHWLRFGSRVSITQYVSGSDLPRFAQMAWPRTSKQSHFLSSSKLIMLLCDPGVIDCNVIATARKPDALAELAGMGLTAVHLDVDSEESIDAAKKRVEELTGGKLDILVNNA
jgi:hypothetical protein